MYRNYQPNLPNQNYKTKPTKLNLPTKAYIIKPTEPNLLNQTYQTKPTKLKLPYLPYQIKHPKLNKTKNLPNET